jgi:hypothetical protein
MFLNETWNKYVNKGMINHKIDIFAEVITREFKQNVKLDYRWLENYCVVLSNMIYMASIEHL